MQTRLMQALVLCLLCTFVGSLTAQQAATESDDDTAKIKAAIESYIAAHNARDVEKLVSHWAPEGVYTSRTSGEQIVGRQAMLTEFKSMFESEDIPKLAVATQSIDFISPNVAVENGVATVTHSADEVVETNYSVVYIRSGGAWLIDRVTEEEIVIESSNRDRLQGLEWLIGEWVDEIDGVKVEMICDWTANQNFISRKFKITSDEQVESSGLQVVGWDPVKKEIRSWLFDSKGGFVLGTWTQRENKWVVQSVATLADGGQGSFTSIFQPQDDGNYSWQKINRIVDGQLLPNLDEVIIQRK